MSRGFEQGRYIAMDVRSGMVLDLSGGDNLSLIAYRFHGSENQQWEFRPCGEGFTINSVFNSKLFLTVRDLKELQLEGRVQIVTGTFPTCWEVEVMGIAEKPYEVFVRIRLPYSDGLSMGLKGSYEGAPLFLGKEAHDLSSHWWLRPPTSSSEVAESAELAE